MESTTAPAVKVSPGQYAASTTVGQVLIALWRGTPQSPNQPMMAHYRLIVQGELDRLTLAYPSGVWYLALVLPTAPLPDAEARKAVQTDLKRWGSKLSHTVTVPMGDSIRESFVRTIMTGMMLLSGQSKSHTIAKTPSAGLRIITTQMGTASPALVALEAAVDAVFEGVGVPRRT
jgi:hypothetical protein